MFYAGAERYAADGQRLVESTGTLMPVFGGGTREIDIVPWDSAQLHYVAQSAVAAQLFEATLRQAVPMNLRALQQAPLRVLGGANMPAVLVEVGYLTNAEQESQLRGGDFQGRLVQAIAEGIVRFDTRSTRARAAAAGHTAMTKGQRTWTVVAVVALAVGLWWVLFIALPRWTVPKPATPPPPQVRTEPTPRIRARLYHLSDDGLRLQPVESEVPFGEGTLEQGRQLAPRCCSRPLNRSYHGAGRHDVKGFYLSPEGVAFVDLSAEAGRAHVGALDEIFIVYSIVNTLTENLPAITAVQLLVDGRQVDTLAGHVDVRRP